jgi:regulator of sirC expression with transglutaminase-like and TPR domain
MSGTLVFAHTVSRPDEEIDLAAAALLIAEREYPDLDVGAYLGRLDELAARARARGGDVTALRGVLFDELGLRGNTGDYYDARNSFLNDVLDRRLGIPITLSVVFLEVGWRLGLKVAGLGYPGHFLVHAEGQLLDCFNGGAEVDRQTLPPGPVPVAGKRAILARMLANLSRIQPVRAWIADFVAALSAPRREGGPPS